MDIKRLLKLSGKNFLFWLSRKIDYPLIAPDVVQVNFTFRCNLACKMCNMHEQMKLLESQGRQTEVDSATFRKIIRETKDLGAGAILFIGGEPLLRRDLFELIGYTKSLNLGTVIVTNGVLLDKDNINRCFETGVDWLSISIDSASERIFGRIRGEDVLEKIIANIELLNGLKKEKKREFPKMVAVCTIMDDNVEELLDIANLARRLEIEKILFQPVVANNADQTQRNAHCAMFVPPDRYNILDKSIDSLIDYKKQSLRDFDFIGNSIKHLGLIKKYFRGNVRLGKFPCYAGYNRVQVIQEGKLYFCVSQQNNEATFGNIKDESLRDLWFSQKAKSYRKSIRKCKFSCLQWCSYRDDFGDWVAIFQKNLLFKKDKK